MTTLSRTTGTPTLGTKFTCSGWFKFSDFPNGGGSDRWLFGEYTDSSNHSYLYLRNTSAIGWYEKASGSTVVSKITNQFIKDTSGWFHIMVAFDTTDSTAEDRFKLYINGNRVSDWGTSTNTYGSSATPRLNASGNTFYIGQATGYGSGQALNGYISHLHFCDGSALAQSVFGETDSTTGIWKIKPSPSFTPGNNGFTILKDDNTITDQSANSNNFTLAAGTINKSEDCPSNVFATLDPLVGPSSNKPTFTFGGNKVVTSTGGNFGGCSTLGANKGKYYFEVKFSAESTSNMGNISICSSQNARESARTNQHANQFPSEAYPNLTYEYDGNVYKDSGSSVGSFGTYSTGDIIIIAMDLDNQKAYFGKNGTWGNSGVPTSGSTGTGAASLTAHDDYWHLALGDRNSSNTATYEVNFGNGYFGSTAVSSAGTNASGFGVFEYDVPTGYTALCTKGINSF